MAKNFNAADLNSLFESAANLDVDGMEDVYELDLDSIVSESSELAASSINNLLSLYNNKEFTNQHPEFKKRIDTEIESLRKYYKMSKMNENMMDHLAKSISNNPGNASLYKSYVSLQDNIDKFDEKIKKIMNEFNKLCVSYQTEINFINESSPSEQDKSNGTTTRGRKAFIEQMENENLFDEQ